MEASGAINPSTVYSSMTRSSRWIFQKILPACRQGYYHWYISLLIQLNNLGTIYWVQWCSQKVGVRGKQCLVWYPSVGKGVIKHMLGVN